MAEQAAKAAADLLAATERQAKAIEEVRAALHEHEHYVFEVGRELSAAGRDLRFAMQLVDRSLDSKACGVYSRGRFVDPRLAVTDTR